MRLSEQFLSLKQNVLTLKTPVISSPQKEYIKDSSEVSQTNSSKNMITKNTVGS